jgi:integrase
LSHFLFSTFHFAEKVLNRKCYDCHMATNLVTPTTHTVPPIEPQSDASIRVFARHSEDCPHSDPNYRKCNCRKHLYIYEAGKVTYKTCKTRSWTEAEKVMQAEKDLRDPVKIELARIAEAEVAKQASKPLIGEALDHWIARFLTKDSKGEDIKATATTSSYLSFKKFVVEFATAKGYTTLDQFTKADLDAWVTKWKGSPNYRAFRLSRLNSFFAYAFNVRMIDLNPTTDLMPIKAENEKQTMPLSKVQFKELIEACDRYDEDRRVDKDKFGADLKALFLVMRWTGVRLSDALMLRRSGADGNRLTMNVQKTPGIQKKTITRVVPVEVIEALAAVPARKAMHADQYFWSRECDHRTLASMWTPRVRRMNEYLDFTDDHGEPLHFHSHMLRDTYAVELLLAGMKIENVSKLLCHSSVRITEKHYAPWNKERTQQLEDETMMVMRRMGATFAGD